VQKPRATKSVEVFVADLVQKLLEEIFDLCKRFETNLMPLRYEHIDEIQIDGLRNKIRQISYALFTDNISDFLQRNP
jgi:DNA-binding GntR family transcriptional regulator